MTGEYFLLLALFFTYRVLHILLAGDRIQANCNGPIVELKGFQDIIPNCFRFIAKFENIYLSL